jgi:hypothetical protein
MTEEEIKKDKARIKIMPVFPDHSALEIVDKENKRKKLIITSSVRIHFEELWNIEVYLYPVETVAFVKTRADKKELLLAHLYKCLEISKYLVVRRETILNLPLEVSLDRKAEDFSEKLWNKYP